MSNGLTEVQVCRFPNQLCTDRGRSDPYGPSCWDEVPGFNRCRRSATHAQCCEVRRMSCIVSTLVTARGRAAPPPLKRFPFERTQDTCHSPCSVIAGLDPAIHLLRKSVLRRRWTRGVEPAGDAREWGSAESMRTGTALAGTLVTARGRAAPPHQPRRYQPGPARRRRGCRRTAPLVDWRTTVQIG